MRSKFSSVIRDKRFIAAAIIAGSVILLTIIILGFVFLRHRMYGFLIALGMVIGIGGGYFVLTKRKYNPDIVFNIALICIPLAIIGARLYYVIFDVLAGESLKDWFSGGRIFGFNDGKFEGFSGLAVYGGIIGAALGAICIVYPLNRRQKNPLDRMSLWQMFDMGFIFIILGQAIGRWGNFANYEAYGNPITNPAWQWFPIAVKVGSGYYQATFFYESFPNFIGFGLMIWLYLSKRKSFDGFIFAFYCVWYGLVRTIVESMRSDSLRLWAEGPRVSQLLSIGLILLGVGIIVYHIIIARQKGKKLFLFVDEKKLDESYFGYDKTIIHMNKIYKRIPKGAKPGSANARGGFSFSEEEKTENKTEEADTQNK